MCLSFILARKEGTKEGTKEEGRKKEGRKTYYRYTIDESK